jgi:Gas vesicle synthesis protein GvpO
MAERRRTRRTTEAARRRRRPEREEPDVFDEDEQEDDERQAFDEDEPEAVFDDDERQAVDEDDEATLDESRPSPVRKSPSNGRTGRHPAARHGNSAMTAGDAAKAALSQVAQLIAKQPEGVTGVERADDGWVIGIEVVEDQRIPSSADILATYETTIDDQGELLSYRRVGRYSRGRGDNGKGS